MIDRMKELNSVELLLVENVWWIGLDWIYFGHWCCHRSRDCSIEQFVKSSNLQSSHGQDEGSYCGAAVGGKFMLSKGKFVLNAFAV